MEIFRPELQSFPLRAILDEARDTIGEGPLTAILDKYQVSAAELLDPAAWVSLEFVEGLLQDLADSASEPSFFERAIARGMTPRYIGPLYPLLFAFGSPIFAYGQLAKSAGRFNKTGLWQSDEMRPGHVRMSWHPTPGMPQERRSFICTSRAVQLGLFPTLFGHFPAQVNHPECILRGAQSCVYEATWTEPPLRRHARVGLLLGMVLALLFALIAGASVALSVALVAGFSVAGWALGRLWMTQQDLDSRVKDIREHNAALTRVTQSNEARYAELLDAKREVDIKVDQRTSELRDATIRLSETLNEIQALDKAKTDFFNNVSHELRSPLTLILAPLDDLVAGRSPPGGDRAAFESMRRNAARLLHLINQLLDLAKIDAGQMDITPVPTDLPKLVASILTGFEAAAKTRDVRIEATIPTGMATVGLDVSWIESAVTNLIANALKFTPPSGEVRVTVGDRGADVYVSVSDDGPGIAPADHEKVFARFAQGDSSRRVVGGTGIGLALVREAARLHGGDVRLVSDLGKGSTFILTLPRRPEHTKHAGAQSQRPDANAQSAQRMAVAEEFRDRSGPSERPGPSPNAPLALVVEDNPELRTFVADVLASSYRVHSVGDGRRALDLARESKPDVIVSDVAMPEMNGYELCRALRHADETRTIPILLVTARTDVASVLEGFEAGANDYVLKPFHGRELLARVDVHVRLRRMVHQLALQERHAALGVLAASVAHQVRNPLTTLISGLPAMQGRMRDKVDQRTADLMAVMIDCATRIERVSLDLMDLSRLDREEGADYRPCDGLRSAVRMLQARAPSTVTVEESIEDCTIIKGRAGDMNHVFLNLLDNAIRAVGKEGTVRIEAWNADGSYLVRVGDSGPGISPEVAMRVFEPFFTTRQAGEGTGLGLAIARQVVQQAGGDIVIERSNLGGAAFLLRIPTLRKRSQPALRAN